MTPFTFIDALPLRGDIIFGWCFRLRARVSEPACFGAAPAPEIFYPEPAPAPGKREQNVGTF